jgi:hypothetical protein
VRQSATGSENASAEEAFAVIDAMSARFVENGALRCGELIVLDLKDAIVRRRTLTT